MATQQTQQNNTTDLAARRDYLSKAFRTLVDKTRRCFVERKDEVVMAVTAILAGEHCCFLGDPGCAKSAVIDQLVKRISGGPNYFWIQLFGDTPPTDVFGQVSLKQLKANDIAVRNTAGHLPEAHFAFLDEIFQAPSSILVGCNSILQERKFMNGTAKVDVPLITMFGASNFYPEDPQLVALWDRFLARKYVPAVSGNKRTLKGLLSMAEPPEAPKPLVSLADIFEAQEFVRATKVSDPVLDQLVELFMTLEHSDKVDRNVKVTDRRKRKAVKWLKATAFLAGRDEVSVVDFGSLVHVLWQHPDDIPVVRELLGSAQPISIEEINQVVEAMRLEYMEWQKLTDEDKLAQAGRWMGDLRRAVMAYEAMKVVAAMTPETQQAWDAAVGQIAAWQDEAIRVLTIPNGLRPAGVNPQQ